MLLIGVALRVASGWATCAVLAANTAGAAVGGRYYPVLMSVVYDRAKCSGSDYQFHLSAEAGWDAGAMLGYLATAVVTCTGDTGDASGRAWDVRDSLLCPGRNERGNRDCDSGVIGSGSFARGRVKGVRSGRVWLDQAWPPSR